ncbi:GNAT family N-acetyltransferase [Micromonospora lupini]|uniref:Lysine N-acyltransferase MbtK n=1 Tax=Micromonospora lupini str. Lupac 08 TaxID=1150864 RepID=I0L5Q9_9ACTN|nr:GNAT family N-acetyltransferase [Micromonospora lupini]CCH19156.1 Putative acetyltransferase [Micromonospora lupini str. Lupac 08]
MSTDEPHHRRDVTGFGVVTVRPVRPDEDADLLHGWVTAERARFWGMREASRERVREIYAYLDSLATHHAYLAHRDGVPVALVQTYEPGADPVGGCYEVLPGDVGVHLLVGPPVTAERGFTGALFGAILEFVFADPGRLRIVMEPDVRNDRMLRRLRRSGFRAGPVIDLPEKRALLHFLDRPAAAG